MHPGYNSARVTLGRALIEVNDLDTAEVELNQVLRSAPENLAAIRGLADVHHRRGELGDALTFYQAALGLAKHDPDLEQTVDDLSRALMPPLTIAARSSDPDPEPEPPALPELERLLEAIHSYRQRREV
jgi:tetratricopeptide (TPR) repeat protein